MNPVMQLAQTMQTPSAHFEASNQMAREILEELAAINRQDTLDMIQARIDAAETVQSFNDDDWYTFNTDTLELQAGRGAHYERPTQPAAPLKTVRGMTAKYLGLWQYKAEVAV